VRLMLRVMIHNFAHIFQTLYAAITRMGILARPKYLKVQSGHVTIIG
jgi:hypothetical protein